MATDMEKAWVTELHVRMDCNGCVQRVKKALHRVNGVHDVHVDLPQQKLTVVGRADPEALVKAIKKTRRTAIIFSHTGPNASEPQGSEPEESTGASATEATSQPPSEAPPAEASTTNPPTDAPPQETPAPEASPPLPEAQGANPTDSTEVVEVPHWNDYPAMGHQIRHEAPYNVTHSYNTNMPPAYVSGYRYLPSPPLEMRYHSVEAYGDGYYQNRGNEEYYQNRGSDGNQLGSMFSDENPNACRIV